MLQLILDEVLTDLNATTHVLEQVDECHSLLVHATVDADEVGLGALQALNQGLLHGVEAGVDFALAEYVHLGPDGDFFKALLHRAEHWEERVAFICLTRRRL